MFKNSDDWGTWNLVDVLEIVIREDVERFGSPTDPGMLEGAGKRIRCLEGKEKVAFPEQLFPIHVQSPLEHKGQQTFFSILLGFGRK